MKPIDSGIHVDKVVNLYEDTKKESYKPAPEIMVLIT